MKKISILGLGYIGLPTAAVLATNGYKVIGVDINSKVVETINAGNVHIEEPGLKTVVEAAVKSGNLIACLKPEKSDVFIISVPTPFTDNKKADLSYVKAACESIVGYLSTGNLVVLESTCPPGTTEEILAILEKTGLKAGEDFYLAHCPERVLPGKILKEIIENDRIIGGINSKSAEAAKTLYRNFVEGNIYLTDATTAEFAKIVENTYRDVNIAFANELSKICMQLGIDVWEVIRLANKHPRVNIHLPGPGVGGHCISVDPWFLVEKSKEAKLIKLGREINDAQPQVVVEMVCDLVKGIKNPKVSIFGVSYKANVDDTRESPAYYITDKLTEQGIKVTVYDPIVKKFDYKKESLEETLQNSDCLLLLVNHRVFEDISAKAIAPLMRNRNIIDTRNFLNPKIWAKEGYNIKILGKSKKYNVINYYVG
jgi:UDP-N-acetyl-D-mannosaminuronic acid dehydrogenase